MSESLDTYEMRAHYLGLSEERLRKMFPPRFEGRLDRWFGRKLAEKVVRERESLRNGIRSRI